MVDVKVSKQKRERPSPPATGPSLRRPHAQRCPVQGERAESARGTPPPPARHPPPSARGSGDRGTRTNLHDGPKISRDLAGRPPPPPRWPAGSGSRLVARVAPLPWRAEVVGDPVAALWAGDRNNINIKQYNCLKVLGELY
ncbi:RNA guanine-N7 methyltransferase activating subunit isoform X2 [Panthera tigris]|uniref:RNA guanine-N7 methyltransferase activating subunit isoform X2 n=1 Tax=Panthera tigris TaxID=9694 RepID=UPI001C6F6F39|nr:RNA guanine-N7 methyltransferase activating subunit isoform X2 [Panthera tigris]